MRENRLSGLEGGVAFGPSLPLSFVFFHDFAGIASVLSWS